MEISEKTFQKIQHNLDLLRRTTQRLIRFGSSGNVDLFARDYETNIREIQQALGEITVTKPVPAGKGSPA